MGRHTQRVCVCVCVCVRARTLTPTHPHVHPRPLLSQENESLILFYYSTSGSLFLLSALSTGKNLERHPLVCCTISDTSLAQFFFFATGETLLEHHPRVCCTISELHHKNVCGAPSTPGEGKRESGRAGEEIGHEGVVCV